MRPIRDTDRLDCLALARELQRNGRCQGPMATYPRAGVREGCNWDEPNADRFCALGAICRAADELNHQREIGEKVCSGWLAGDCYRLLQTALRARPATRFRSPAEFNDRWGVTKRQVLALYDRAAALVGK